MILTIQKIKNICRGSLISGDENIEVKFYSKDTRTLLKGDCYIGIKGDNFDGNDYYKEAIQKGAIACILDKVPNEEVKIPIILVKNSIQALQDIACYIRNQKNIPIIAITGSVGKTSTKDIIAEILKQKYNVLKTPGNLNGQIGLPLSILNSSEEEVMVLEMGMNQFGEISKLSKITRPTIGVITNIGTAHIGNLGSRKNILKAKLEILDGMEKEGSIIINQDNDLLSTLSLPYQIHTCGIHNLSEYQASNIIVKNSKTHFQVQYHNKIIPLEIPIMGDVFVQNSLFAIAVGDMLGLNEQQIQNGLKNIKLSSNRMEVIHLKNNITIIDDTYNANYEAIESALHTLIQYPSKRKIAILGDILELENFKEDIHRKIGNLETLKNLDALFLTGEASHFIYEEAIQNEIQNVYYFENKEALEQKLLGYIEPEDTILIKASHSMNFQHIVDTLKDNFK